ncbi:RNA guanylyltransferase and 5'-phosphatase mRNA capping enzyme [Tachypleus tridentatus]|uniref:RNA guanylyltransferase and 5'-phosphatase mRNA capping enzyme n=1 Tax=Tachypleus tridentatus TaxID=6853 RepID=UPI003FD622A8
MSEHKRKNNTKLGPPPRWLDCPRKGALIAEKFLPFKTPLSEAYDEYVPESSRFTPTMFLKLLASYKVKLGLWIDLTNTTRFYDKKDIEVEGIKYLKLQCTGHGETPSVEQTETFIQVCHNFISKNPLDIIGVHCTHGFNRTGYLIVSYLVENLSWSVEAAVQDFSKARPPGIYKADYLYELFKRFGDPADTPPPPQLPSWCTDSDHTLDDDDDGSFLESNGESSKPHVHKRRKREFNKKNPTFMEGVPGVQPIDKQPKLVQIQRKAQNMCNWEDSGFPGCQPVSMDTDNINLLQLKPYKVSWKADGTRYMMLLDGENEVYFIDRDNAVFQVSGLNFPKRKDPDKHICDTLLDGEMIIDKVDGKNVPRYLVYDIVKFEGQQVGGTDFDRRLLCIKKEIIGPRIQAMEEGRIDRMTEPFSVRAKEFWDITCTKSLLSEKFTRNLAHDLDGLIFQPVPDPYVSGRCMDVLKWKPLSVNSIDFRLMIKKEHRIAMLPETKGYLFVGGCDQPFGEIKVTKELKNLDKKIIECKFEDNQWKFMRERTDKSFPNGYTTAIAVCQSIQDPVTTEKLLDFIEHHRWKPHKRSHSSMSNEGEIMPPSNKVPRR